MGEGEFEEAVGQALDLLPPEMLDVMDNVVIMIAAEPSEEQLAGGNVDDLLGLYEGTPLTERDSFEWAGALPDVIHIFRGPILRMCETEEEVREEVAITVVHEIAHHFGIPDERLHALGWA
ncbi:MAG: metallopeptidase family protein [Actinomycetaceae bacterium]|nr:metallopeptidase family protein [Actinomycetaceae bacterium]